MTELAVVPATAETAGSTSVGIDNRAKAHSPTLFSEGAPHSAKQIALWQAEIDRRVPSGDHMTRLWLRWEPGDIWQPVQRYVIWELVPNTDSEGNAVVRHDVRIALNGPHPRSTGHADYQTKRWVGGACKVAGIDRGTYEVFQETGRYGQRWWAIQGKGGHPMDVPWIRQKTAQIMKEPYPVPPAIGDLPYCEPGERIWDRIAGYDKYRGWRYGVDWAFRNIAHLTAEETTQMEQYAALATDWWDTQIMECLDEVPMTRKNDLGAEVRSIADKGGIRAHSGLTDSNSRLVL